VGKTFHKEILMRLQETPRDEEGHELIGAWPDPPVREDGHIDHARVVTSSGEGVTGGIAAGSADRKIPDEWARDHGTADNLGPGALNVPSEHHTPEGERSQLES
jgi:hypothetical protein